MADEITESMVYEALGRIAHLGVTHRRIQDLGLVAGVEVHGERVRVALALPHANAPTGEELVRQVRRAVGSIRAGLDVARTTWTEG